MHILNSNLEPMPLHGSILRNTDDPKARCRNAQQAILVQDNRLKLEVASQCQSVELFLNINWLHVWEAA